MLTLLPARSNSILQTRATSVSISVATLVVFIGAWRPVPTCPNIGGRLFRLVVLVVVWPVLTAYGTNVVKNVHRTLTLISAMSMLDLNMDPRMLTRLSALETLLVGTMTRTLTAETRQKELTRMLVTMTAWGML